MMACVLFAAFFLPLLAQNTGNPSVGVVISQNVISTTGAAISATIEKVVASTHPPPYVVSTCTW